MKQNSDLKSLDQFIDEESFSMVKRKIIWSQIENIEQGHGENSQKIWRTAENKHQITTDI